MKARIIYTNFYESERVLALSVKSRWLFMYYLTCPYIGLTGAFKVAKSKISFETGLTVTEIKKAAEELQNSGLVLHFKEWIFVPDTEEKTNYDKGQKTSVAYNKEYEKLPEEVKDLIINKNIYPIDRVSEYPDTPRNQKSENRNNNSSSLVLSSSYLDQLDTLRHSEVPEVLTQKYGCTVAFVLSKIDDLENWIGEKPSRARGRNLERTLAAWVKKDALSVRKDHNGKSRIEFINE